MTDTVETLRAEIDVMKANYDEALDTIWEIVAALLVFFMHAGFSMLEAGCVRFKNTQNILAKNLVVVTVGFLSWWLSGWAFAYGESSNQWIGLGGFAMTGFFEETGDGPVPTSKFRNWFFQGAFCATCSTIVSGAVAERIQLRGFALFTFVMTALIYPVVVYWGWSGVGILSGPFGFPGLNDFAGSGLVHMSGGVAALVGAIAVGPRKGRWDEGQEQSFESHNIPFVVLGTFFLWFGWYGFNPGSTLAMKTAADATTAGLVACNTTLAPCVAGLVVFFLRAQVCPPKRLDVGGFCNGILAGLVSITAGCGSVRPWESIVIGLIGGHVYQGASMLLKYLQIDDVVDAIPVHGACGLWGVLAAGIFGGPETGLIITQVIAIIMIFVWVGALSALVFFPLKMFDMLRLPDEIQDKGADVMEHSQAKAYMGARGASLMGTELQSS